VELDDHGLHKVTWLDFPIPRNVTTLTDSIDELLTSAKYAEFADDWICAVITDQVRPMDAMSRLRARFPNCATLEFAPSFVAEDAPQTYGSRVVGKSDIQVVGGFLEFVRNGHSATESELALLSQALIELESEEAAR